MFDLLIKDNAFTKVAVFGMSEPDVALALQQPWVSVDNDSQGTAPDGVLGQEHPHPRAYGTFPRILRKFVREEQKLTAGRCHPKIHGAAGAAHAPDRRGVLKEGHVGRRGGLRSGDDPRPRDVREAEPAVGGNGVRAGERRPGDRRRKDDESAAGEGAAWSGVPAVNRKAMEQIQCGDQIVKFDCEKTRMAYAAMQTGNAERCGCSGCRNFAAQRKSAYPDHFLVLLAQMGIDPEKEGEVYECRTEGELYRYGGWFFCVGEIVSIGERLVEMLRDFNTGLPMASSVPDRPLTLEKKFLPFINHKSSPDYSAATVTTHEMIRHSQCNNRG